ncbi:hypothetical protein [Piscinibacter gummiphilus]|uniref:NnrS family protein n=1 Tax=Piscinibacter gummiphilus TaxID=946333 RepID=A0ABZ0D113_9BURK|nr:hypothetical protein [Piscinibacter gummiphilus]WOB10835.1 hypothetical protein RXV79_12455 [Piscinibacter gummiphilus]
MVTQRLALRFAFLALVATALVTGIAGGLVRAGVSWEALSGTSWLPRAVLGHAFLMVSAFLGTVIGLERAVALKHPAAFTAPAASGLSGVLLVSGLADLAAWLAVLAASAFVWVNVVVVRRQRADHTVLLLVAAVAWWIGALTHALGGMAQGAISWWLAFLVLTIAAERLEMTRLMRRRPGAQPTLLAGLVVLLVGCGLSLFERSVVPGGLFYGAALLALSGWLFRFDIARKTLFAHGLSRYMAVCLLLGYGWLAVAGLAWIGSSLGLPWRDAALHGLALGFVFSMILGHAPVILPALTRVKIAFSWAFYLPLALLHGSLVARLLLSHAEPSLVRMGSALNALAIVAFVLTVAASAIAWKSKFATERTRP